MTTIAKAQATRAFYEEYFAVADLPAEFYLETVQYVFQECALAHGASYTGAAAWSMRARSGARRCSRSKASATTSAPSDKRWPRTICAPA